MDSQTKKEILKVIGMILTLVVLIGAIVWLNSKSLDERVENRIQSTIEGKTIVDEEKYIEESENINEE